MYKSVIRESEFLVLIADGVFDSPLMELPTEELADKVALSSNQLGMKVNYKELTKCAKNLTVN